MERKDIEFYAEGATLRGWFFSADPAEARAPTVIMAHGFAALKEHYLDRYAEVFARAGLNALVFDNRNFGASDGEPRLEIDPWQQVRDYRHAITYASTLDQVDPERIGIWGSSYSGGHVLTVAALDRRVKAVVSQVPLVDGYESFRRLIRPDFIGPLREQFDEDRMNRFRGEPPAMLPVVAEDPLAPSALPTLDSYEWFSKAAQTVALGWPNEVTLRTIEMFTEYSPIHYVARISPTPLLILTAQEDVLCLVDMINLAYEQALQPKRLEYLPGGHFDAYINGFDRSSTLARDWFVDHLLP